jgi:hypothetical protein
LRRPQGPAADDLEAKGLAGGVLDTRILQLGKSFNALSPEKKKFALGVIHELMKRSLLND